MPLAITKPQVFQKAYAFLVEIPGVKRQSFASVDGLCFGDRLEGHSGTRIENRLTLRRGKVEDDNDLMALFYNGLPISHITIIMLDREGYVVQRLQVPAPTFLTLQVGLLSNDLDENVMETATFSYLDMEPLPLTYEDKAALLARIERKVAQRLSDALTAVDDAISAHSKARTEVAAELEQARKKYAPAS